MHPLSCYAPHMLLLSHQHRRMPLQESADPSLLSSLSLSHAHARVAEEEGEERNAKFLSLSLSLHLVAQPTCNRMGKVEGSNEEEEEG